MMAQKYREAATEVLEILKLMNEEDVNKIPPKFIEFLAENAADDYFYIVDTSRPLEEQNLKTETKALLAVLYKLYWCETEEEKEELLKTFFINEQIFQKEQREKYNPDDIFKNRNK